MDANGSESKKSFCRKKNSKGSNDKDRNYVHDSMKPCYNEDPIVGIFVGNGVYFGTEVKKGRLNGLYYQANGYKKYVTNNQELISFIN